MTAQEGPPDGTWNAFSCKDGLTGCVGFAGDNERALMLSYVVRAPPRLVVKVCQASWFKGVGSRPWVSLETPGLGALEAVTC